MSPDHQQSITK